MDEDTRVTPAPMPPVDPTAYDPPPMDPNPFGTLSNSSTSTSTPSPQACDTPPPMDPTPFDTTSSEDTPTPSPTTRLCDPHPPLAGPQPFGSSSDGTSDPQPPTTQPNALDIETPTPAALHVNPSPQLPHEDHPSTPLRIAQQNKLYHLCIQGGIYFSVAQLIIFPHLATGLFFFTEPYATTTSWASRLCLSSIGSLLLIALLSGALLLRPRDKDGGEIPLWEQRVVFWLRYSLPVALLVGIAGLVVARGPEGWLLVFDCVAFGALGVFFTWAILESVGDDWRKRKGHGKGFEGIPG